MDVVPSSPAQATGGGGGGDGRSRQRCMGAEDGKGSSQLSMPISFNKISDRVDRITTFLV